MSNNFNRPNIGEQFKDAVNKGLSTGDFRELNTLVTDTVTDAIADAGKQVKNTTYHKTTYRTTTETRHGKYYNYDYEADKQKRQSKTTLPAVKTKNVGQISSILYTVFGAIGTGIFSITAFILFICSFSWQGLIPTCIGFGLADIASILALRKGLSEKGRLDRMKRYVALCGEKMYINIADLAEQVGKSSKFILKDVRKMLELGFFPEGHLDKKGTCLMLDDKTYREYLSLEQQRKSLEVNTTVPNSSTSDTNENRELQEMISEGQDFINQIHQLNEIIPEENISNKMYRMESLLREIFARLKEDPTQMHKMHKLMKYYLPTTIKLLQSYSEFDDVSTPGPDILSAKAEIEKTVDTINEAFAELLNKLFQATVFDATTDAQVLQTMLAKEGLTKNILSEDKK